MKTRNNIDEQRLPPDNAAPKQRSRRMAGLVGAVLVVALVVGASAVVFAQLGLQHKNQAALAPGSNWMQVLNGYNLTSLAANGTTPAVVYACATHSNVYTPLPGSPSNRGGTGNDSYTVLRSSDFGTHWQDVGSQANLGNNCQLAINAADSSDLYVVASVQNNGQPTNVLRHSTDGGQTWTTITPTLNVPDSKSTPPWNVQQLSMAGNHLFGVQWLPRHLPLPSQAAPPRYSPQLARLVTSVDGGRTWTVLDNQFAVASQEVRSYAVDPTHSSTIYELVASPWFPLPYVAEPNDSIPPAGSGADLYKSSDNGASWQLLLKGLPVGAHVQVQLVQGNAQMIYVGGSITPVPLAAAHPGGKVNIVQGSFHLHLSRDGGASWHDVPDLPQSFSVQNWFAGGDGQVYAYAAGLYAHPAVPGGQPGAVSGTAIPATPRAVPSSVPQGSIGSIEGSIAVTTAALSIAYQSLTAATPNFTAGPLASMQRYNPATDTWNAMVTPPSSGTLLALTPAQAAAANVLWFMGIQKAQPVLYRYSA